MEQLILHLIGDYVTQSDWMAQNKTKRAWPAYFHALVYSLPFLLLCNTGLSYLVIFGTHFLIDRYRLARFVVWAKNVFFSGDFWSWLMCWHRSERLWNIWPRFSWGNCSETGYPKDLPAWISVWLLIAADNTLHLAINYAAIRWL